MSVTYTKQINSMDCYSEIDGNSDVVFTINWTLVGTDDVFEANYRCSTEVPYVSGQPFTPFNELTEEQVISWIEEYTSPDWMTQYEETIVRDINIKKTIITPTLPWQANTSTSGPSA